MNQRDVANLDLNERLAKAVRAFWETRLSQGKKQGQSGKKDQGSRSDVTGGKHLNGFIELISEIACNGGCNPRHVFIDKQLELPGFFRPVKKWDVVIVRDGHLVAAIEIKSHVGPSFGNNYNNRTEEALGNATDIHAAYREGTFRPSPRPWLGYIMLLEDQKKSRSPVKTKEPHFRVRDEFRNTSYAQRYSLLCEKLLRERHYDAACFLLSPAGLTGAYSEPHQELTFSRFAQSLTRAVSTHTSPL